MGNFVYNGKRQILTMVPVEKIIGKMTQVKNTCNADTEVRHRWMGGSWRKSTERNLLVVRTNVRSTPITPDEITSRLNFENAVAATKITLANTQLRAQIQSQYRSEKSTMGKFPVSYRTIRGWVLAVRYVEILEKGEDFDVTHFPQLDS